MGGTYGFKKQRIRGGGPEGTFRPTNGFQKGGGRGILLKGKGRRGAFLRAREIT